MKNTSERYSHVEIVDPFEGGIRCKKCGAIDSTLKFPISPTQKMALVEKFAKLHENCTGAKS